MNNNNKRILFIIAGLAMLLVSVFVAIDLMDIVQRGQEIKDLQQKIEVANEPNLILGETR